MFTPTRDQEIALGKIRKFLNSKEHVFVLNGIGGSGKSSVISVITEEMYRKGRRVIGGAFTNKATNVLAKKNPYMAKMTLFKMLEMKADETGEQLRFQSVKSKMDSEIRYVDLIILDEVSQVLDEHLQDLIDQVKLYNKKLILMGDSYQLNPIDQTTDSFAFSLPNKYELREIIRQAKHSDIPLYAGQIRDILDKIRTGEKIPITRKLEHNSLKEGSDVSVLSDTFAFMDQFLADFNSEYYKNDNDYVKVIAYRNSTIDKINQLVRKSLFEDAESPIVEGDRLVLNNPGYAFDDEEGILAAYDTSEELNVLKILDRKIYDSKHMGIRIQFPYCVCEVIEKESKSTAQMAFLYPAFKDKFEEQMRDWAKEISKLENRHRKRVFKEEFYPFKKKFNIAGYAYAMTSHKMQGMTINRAYVVLDDLHKVPADSKTLWSSLYVMCSRPSEKLIILDRS